MSVQIYSHRNALCVYQIWRYDLTANVKSNNEADAIIKLLRRSLFCYVVLAILRFTLLWAVESWLFFCFLSCFRSQRGVCRCSSCCRGKSSSFDQKFGSWSSEKKCGVEGSFSSFGIGVWGGFHVLVFEHCLFGPVEDLRLRVMGIYGWRRLENGV